MPKVAILAGGLATRLYPVTRTIPKAMLEITGKPFIFHQLNLLKRKGIKEVVICAGYLGEQIQGYLKDGKEVGISIKYSFDGDKLLGTGGALRKALPLLGDYFGVLYGDSYLDTDFSLVLNVFLSNNNLGLMTVLRNDNQWDKSNIIFFDGKIFKYDKKNHTPDMKHIDYGLALLRKKALEEFPEREVFDLADLYVNLINRKEMLGYEVIERFYEVGSVKGLQETKEYLEAFNKKLLEGGERK